MPLKIRLKPREKFVVNGAVISAGDEGAFLILQNKAALMRQSDILQLEDAKSPMRRIYFFIQMMYLEPNNEKEHYESYQEAWMDMVANTSLAEIKRSLILIHQDIMNKEFYRALKTSKAVIALEDELLSMTFEDMK